MKTKKSILILALVLICTQVSAQPYEVFYLDIVLYRNNTVKVEKVGITWGDANVFSSQRGGYRIELCSPNQTLYAGNFTVGFQTHRDKIDENGNLHSELVELNEARKLLAVPYQPEAEWVRIYANGTLVHHLNISTRVCIEDGECHGYCMGGEDPDCEEGIIKTRCGNNVCNKGENYGVCPLDCSSGEEDNYCDRKEDLKCDPDCLPGQDSDCLTTTMATTLPTTTLEQESGDDLSGYLPYLLGLAILVIIAFVVLRSRRLRRAERKGREEKEELREWIERELRNGEDPELLKKALERQGSDPSMVDEVMGKL